MLTREQIQNFIKLSLQHFKQAQNLNEVLHVTPTASNSEISAAYHRLALLYQDNKGGSGVAFKVMKAAYDVLSDAAGRVYYNAQAFPRGTDSQSGEDGDQDVYSEPSPSSSDSESDSCASCASKAIQIAALKRKVALLVQQLAEERRRSSQGAGPSEKRRRSSQDAGPSGSQGGTSHGRSAGGGIFECGKCHKKLSTKPHLKRHTKVCSKGNPMACAICGKVYFLKESLNRHMGSKHP